MCIHFYLFALQHSILVHLSFTLYVFPQKFIHLCMYLSVFYCLSLYIPIFSIFYVYIGTSFYYFFIFVCTCVFYFLSLYWYLFLLFSIFECKCVFQSFVSWTFSISACNSFLFLFLHSSNAFKKFPLRRNFSQYINPFTVLNKMNSIPRRRFICADFSFTCKQLMCFFFLFSSFLSCS